MADNERPLLDKILDGASAIGDSINGKLGAYAEEKKKEEQLLENMSYVDRLKTDLGYGGPKFQANNFGDVQSTLNAQNPVPAAASWPSQSVQDTINTAVPNLVQSSAALQNQAPLNPEQLNELSGNIPVGDFVNDPAYNKGAFLAPNPVAAPTIPEPVQQSAQQTINGVVNPLAGSQAMALSGIQDAQDAGEKLAAAQTAFYGKKADEEQKAMDKQQALEDNFNLKYQERMDEYTDMLKDFKELAGQKVVPGAFLARQDTSAALSTGIAVAMGAMAGALNGTNQNIGLEMINKAIDRDVDAQKYNLDQAYRIKKSSIDDQSNLLSKMRERFGDEKSAILATKLAMQAMVEHRMNQELTQKGGYANLQSQANAKMAKSAIIAQKEKLEYELKAAQAAAYAKQHMMDGKDYYNLTNEDALQAFGKDADKYVRGYGMTTDPQLAKDFIQKVKPMSDTIRKLKSTISSIDNLSMFNPKDRGALQAIMTDLQLTLKDEENYKLGVLTGPDMDLLQKVTGDPTSFNALTNISTKSRIKEALRNVEAKMNNKITNYGFDLPQDRAGSVKSLVKPIKP